MGGPFLGTTEQVFHEGIIDDGYVATVGSGYAFGNLQADHFEFGAGNIVHSCIMGNALI